MMTTITEGNRVRKSHYWDGTQEAGKPAGPILTVTKVEDHRPCGTLLEKNVVCHLSDGTWEFSWNLHKLEEK